MKLLLSIFGTCTLIACCALGLPAQASESSTKGRALLIGINKYQSFPSLRGAANDVDAIRQLLVTRYGFAEASVQVLLDQEATRQGILSALAKLQQTAKADETIYVHFSGYGSLVKLYRDDRKEPIVRETLIPYDGRTGTTPDILVEDIQTSLDKVSSKAVVFVTDAAYSVTTSRTGKVLTRAIAADTRPNLYTHVLNERGGPTGTSAQARLAAAGLQQAALDGPVDGKYYGLFSYALARSLASNKSSAATQDIFAGVERELRRVQTQLGLTSLPEPRLIATTDRSNNPLFHAARAGSPSSSDTRLAYVDVDPQGADRVVLVNSLGLGALAGSSWAIYPPQEAEFVPGQALAIAIVTETQGNNALARVEPATMAIERGSRAVLVAPPAPNRIPIRLQNMSPEREQNLKASLQQKMPTLNFVGKEEFARYVVDEQGETLFVAAADGMTTVGAIPMSNESSLAGSLATLLSRSTNAATLVSLDNPSSKIQLKARVASDATGRRIMLSSADFLNPDRNGKPLSLVVRLYQLSGKDKFEQATYQALLKGDHKVLEGELLTKSEITLHPNSQEVVRIDPRKETQYIGVMAMFRDPQSQQWRRTIPIRDVTAHALDVAFEGNSISGVSRETLVATRGIKLVANTSASRVRIKQDHEPRTAENSLQLAIQANCDCYVTIVDVDSEGGINLLFPNGEQERTFYPKGKVQAGETVLVPDSLNAVNKAGFHLDYSIPAGVDTIRVFASTDLETAEMIRRHATNPAQAPAPSAPTFEAEKNNQPLIVVASATLNELKSGLRTRGVKVTKNSPPSQTTGTPSASVGMPDQGASPLMPVGLPGPDWTATSVTVVVDP
jgi:type VI secretion system VasD/TssJ family lipoprotein